MSRLVAILVIQWATSKAFESQEKCLGTPQPAVTASSLAQLRSSVTDEAFRLDQAGANKMAEDEFAEKIPDAPQDRQTVPAQNAHDVQSAEEKDEQASSLANLDSHEALSSWERIRGGSMWHHALSHVQFDEARLLQHLQRIETQHVQKAKTSIEDSMNTTGCNFAQIKKDALQSDELEKKDNSVSDFATDALGTSGAALGVAAAFAGPKGAVIATMAQGVHGVLGTAWGKANPGITMNEVKAECKKMLDTQGEKIVELVNTQMQHVSQCVGRLKGHVHKLFSALTHFNLLSDEGLVQRGYAGLMLQMAGGVTDQNLIANAIDRNLGHCGNVHNYIKWVENTEIKNAKEELQRLLPVARNWMKVCNKLSLDFVVLLSKKIPFTEKYVETVNIMVASGFVKFMDVVTRHTHLRPNYYAAVNYRNWFLMMKFHRENKLRSYPAQQARKGGKWRSENAPFCRKYGTNRADNHRYVMNHGVWETRDSYQNCLDTGGWYSSGGVKHDLHFKWVRDVRRRRSYYYSRYRGHRGRGWRSGRLLEKDSETARANKSMT